MTRAWKAFLFVALLATTWLLLAPRPPPIPGEDGIPFLDKATHVLVFAGLALLASRAYPDKPRWGVFAALVLYGAAIELAQARSGRAPELLDLVADAAGAAAVFLVPDRRVRGR